MSKIFCIVDDGINQLQYEVLAIFGGMAVIKHISGLHQPEVVPLDALSQLTIATDIEAVTPLK